MKIKGLSFVVLILVLMEYGLGPFRRFSERIGMAVLILVLMEYGLGLSVILADDSELERVLILVLIEYGLGLIRVTGVRVINCKS